jgi:hypothetical protein
MEKKKRSKWNIYLSDTGTDTGQDGECLLVDIVPKDDLVKNRVLLVGCKLDSLDHDRDVLWIDLMTCSNRRKATGEGGAAQIKQKKILTLVHGVRLGALRGNDKTESLLTVEELDSSGSAGADRGRHCSKKRKSEG